MKQIKNRTYCALLLAVLAASSCASVNGVEAADRPEKGSVRSFKVENEIIINVPEGANHLRAWVVLPREDDSAQTLTDMVVTSRAKNKRATDQYGNRFAYLDLRSPEPGPLHITTRFVIQRREQTTTPDPEQTRPIEPTEATRYAAWLADSRHVAVTQEIRDLSQEITKGDPNPVSASRAIYDWVLENIDYWVKDPANKKASPVGSSEYCLSTKTGNCTDFHALYTALSRAAGIPTRIIYGSLLKEQLDGHDKDQSYHCWVEFYAPNLGWIPVDVALADIFYGTFPLDDSNVQLVNLTTADGYTKPDQEKVDFYFGNLDNRRVSWTHGRDLRLDPAPALGAVHALPKAYVEIDGKSFNDKSSWTRRLTFTEVSHPD